MSFELIRKVFDDGDVTPNLIDYQRGCERFSWSSARGELDGLPNCCGLNIAHEAVDRHAQNGRRNHVALRWLAKTGQQRDISYGELARQTNRFANVLAELGVSAGDAVYVLAGRIPELYIAALGTLKNRSVFCPLFSAFGPEPVRARLAIGQGKVLITTESLYHRKVASIRDSLPNLKHVLIVSESGLPTHIAETLDLASLLGAASDQFQIPVTNPADLALLHFTSGTTGTPKGAMHVHEAVVAHHITGKLALDLHPDDVFWCTADPGWVTGTSYGIIAPLTNGVTSIIDEGEFDAQRWYRIIEQQRVTVWYSAPTAIRLMMRLGEEIVRQHDLSSLRFLASVGEPLNPEAVIWSHRAFGKAFHDNWWQTETGGIMVANFACMDIRPGSMGRPLPGIEAEIVRRAESGNIEVVTSGDSGELALRTGWPSMFRGYFGQPERYNNCFADGWYLTGDLARRDEDGYFWFVGRKDDVIKTSGHLIGPFEVESVLLEHRAVAEAGVIGKPDPQAYEIVKAFVALKPDFQPSDELRRELLGLSRSRLGAAVAPKEIEFIPKLPKTRSGKIMRRLLKARELGLPEGDTSTLEET